jgi:hypothetical protein
MRILIHIIIINLVFCTVSGQGKRRPMTMNPGSGYANYNEIAGGFGLSHTSLSNSKYYYGLTTTHGYQLNIYGLNVNRDLFGGVGTGVLFYEGGLHIPLSLDLRFAWNINKISPFVSGDGGFLFSIDDVDYKTMMIINGGGGIKIKINPNLYATFGTGLRVQMAVGGRRSFVNAKIGLGFKAR